MSDQNDDSPHFALMVLAGIVLLVLTGVIALAIATTRGHATARAAGAAPVAAVEAAATAAAGEPAGRVYFAVGSAALPAEASEVLVRIADMARAEAGRVVLISGFNDATGDAATNAALSKNRALAVRHALEANGVPPEQLVMDKPAVTTGSGDPLAARRVELRFR